MPSRRTPHENALPHELEAWDFSNTSQNSTPGLVNRQKSAANLTLLTLDDQKALATFLDPKTKAEIATSLLTCECRDFLFVGKGRRRQLQPCMHIYRLAMELGLLEPRYLDHAAREALQQRRIRELGRQEDRRLARLGRDPEQWGAWPTEVHQSGPQRNRQYRAYLVLDDELDAVTHDSEGWRVRGHRANLEYCECEDFVARRLPCKHIYTVALAAGINLPLTRPEYVLARKQGLALVFEFDAPRPGPLDRA